MWISGEAGSSASSEPLRQNKSHGVHRNLSYYEVKRLQLHCSNEFRQNTKRRLAALDKHSKRLITFIDVRSRILKQVNVKNFSSAAAAAAARAFFFHFTALGQIFILISRPLPDSEPDGVWGCF